MNASRPTPERPGIAELPRDGRDGERYLEAPRRRANDPEACCEPRVPARIGSILMHKPPMQVKPFQTPLRAFCTSFSSLAERLPHTPSTAAASAPTAASASSFWKLLHSIERETPKLWCGPRVSADAALVSGPHPSGCSAEPTAVALACVRLLSVNWSRGAGTFPAVSVGTLRRCRP